MVTKMSILNDESEYKKYRKKPIVVRARQMPGYFIIETLKGKMKGSPGDYLVLGVKGEKSAKARYNILV